ncbi:MAG: hypothetical protein EHM72_13285 [Calditrichaeota bacterium]|nr:MAG: hypothetical protein EHM72_13285 [Calditrichota bacterium]
MKPSILFFSLLLMGAGRLWSLTTVSMISAVDSEGCFALVTGDAAAPLLLSRSDYPGVNRVAAILQADIERVTDSKPAIFFDELPAVNNVVIIGALSTPFIKRLVEEKKIKVDDLVGKWEKFLLQVVENPFPGMKRALVITGSDKRAVLYAMFELSAQIGVSPWT